MENASSKHKQHFQAKKPYNLPHLITQTMEKEIRQKHMLNFKQKSSPVEGLLAVKQQGISNCNSEAQV